MGDWCCIEDVGVILPAEDQINHVVEHGGFLEGRIRCGDFDKRFNINWDVCELEKLDEPILDLALVPLYGRRDVYFVCIEVFCSFNLPCPFLPEVLADEA